MSIENTCQDCSKFGYNFDIALVDELNQPISSVPFKVLLANSGFLLANGTTDAQGKIILFDMPPKPLRLVLDTDQFLEIMQQESRYLRTSRNPDDSEVKKRAKNNGDEYDFLKVGDLIEQLPKIDNWPVKNHKNANWIDKEGALLKGALPSLPKYHFPYSQENSKGYIINPMGKIHKNRVITLEVTPFRAWILVLDYTQDYSLVNAHNLALMSVLAYAGFTQSGEDKDGSIQQFFGEALSDLSQLPGKVNGQDFIPIVKDVPFNHRYTQYEFIDTGIEQYGNEGDTQLLYATNQTQALIAWRGTQEGLDWWTDLKGVQIKSDPIIATGSMHLGFKQAFKESNSLNKQGKSAFNRLKQSISDKELFVTGHSLGGALALIDCVTKQDLNPLLYTYGMPRVFDREAVEQIHLTHYRHVNENDLIASVPHQDWTTMKLGLIHLSGTPLLPDTKHDYYHHGHLVHFVNASGYVDPNGSSNRNYASKGWMASSNPVEKDSFKFIISPDAIGASCDKMFDLLCRQYNSAELDAPVNKRANPMDHPSASYANYLNKRIFGKLHAWQDSGQGYEVEKQNYLTKLRDYSETNINTLALGHADDLLLDQSFSINIDDAVVRSALLRFLATDIKFEP